MYKRQVVDIGGGTTGLAILKEGKVVQIEDEPTGGTHLTLVLSGNYHVSFEEAEAIDVYKRQRRKSFSRQSRRSWRSKTTEHASRFETAPGMKFSERNGTVCS